MRENDVCVAPGASGSSGIGGGNGSSSVISRSERRRRLVCAAVGRKVGSMVPKKRIGAGPAPSTAATVTTPAPAAPSHAHAHPHAHTAGGDGIGGGGSILPPLKTFATSRPALAPNAGSALRDLSKNTAVDVSGRRRLPRLSKQRTVVAPTINTSTNTSIVSSSSGSSDGGGGRSRSGSGWSSGSSSGGGNPRGGGGGAAFFDDWFFFVLFVVKLSEVDGLCPKKVTHGSGAAVSDKGGYRSVNGGGNGFLGGVCGVCKCGRGLAAPGMRVRPNTGVHKCKYYTGT